MLTMINKIKNILRKEIQEFDRTYKKAIESESFFIGSLINYFFLAKGKHIRPLLTILTAKLSGEPSEITYRCAVTLELLHEASLLHDDVVDKAKFRRGLPVINKIWNNKSAVLLGDYLLSSSYSTILESDNLEILKALSEAAKKLTRGELNQLNRNRKKSFDRNEYLEIIKDKTASLFTAAAKMGGISSGLKKDDISKVTSYAEKIGTSFQLTDDLLDYKGKKRVLGKDIFQDLKEGKITMPMIFALENSSSNERRTVLKKIKRKWPDTDIDYLSDFVTEKKGIDLTEKFIAEITESAKKDIFTINGNEEAKKLLCNFADMLSGRDK